MTRPTGPASPTLAAAAAIVASSHRSIGSVRTPCGTDAPSERARRLARGPHALRARGSRLHLCRRTHRRRPRWSGAWGSRRGLPVDGGASAPPAKDQTEIVGRHHDALVQMQIVRSGSRRDRLDVADPPGGIPSAQAVVERGVARRGVASSSRKGP